MRFDEPSGMDSPLNLKLNYVGLFLADAPKRFFCAAAICGEGFDKLQGFPHHTQAPLATGAHENGRGPLGAFHDARGVPRRRHRDSRSELVGNSDAVLLYNSPHVGLSDPFLAVVAAESGVLLPTLLSSAN